VPLIIEEGVEASVHFPKAMPAPVVYTYVPGAVHIPDESYPARYTDDAPHVIGSKSAEYPLPLGQAAAVIDFLAPTLTMRMALAAYAAGVVTALSAVVAVSPFDAAAFAMQCCVLAVGTFTVTAWAVTPHPPAVGSTTGVTYVT
jgi:hypothetical protein